jgi:hypothetical protein
MVILNTETTTISFDMDGDAYFMVGDTVYYLNDFVKLNDFFGVNPFDGVTHITNTGGVGIKINEAEETVEYSFFTNQ